MARSLKMANRNGGKASAKCDISALSVTFCLQNTAVTRRRRGGKKQGGWRSGVNLLVTTRRATWLYLWVLWEVLRDRFFVKAIPPA